MNAGIEKNHISINYYDSDYPSKWNSLYPENFDATVKYQGLEADIERFAEIASENGNNILELCCGTGRVAIPLARFGYNVTGIDISSDMLSRFKAKLMKETDEVKTKVKICEQDITTLNIEKKDFDIAICAFNSFLCIPDFDLQCKALESASKHLKKNGLLILDIVNPLMLSINGDQNAKPFFTRINSETGNQYTRFAMCDAFDENQKQRLHGWYDEVDPEGNVKRKYYSMHWRPVFRFEAELMLKQAGFKVIKIEGGHKKEAFAANSPKMVIHAMKVR